MPRRFTMATLVTRCKRRADQENSSFVSDAEWKTLISEKYGELYGVVCDTGSRYFETSSTITATGATSYAEPTDHRSTIGMDRLSGTTRVPVFGPIEPSERHLYSGQTGDARYFTHVDDQIYLHPNPSSGTYYYLYIPQSPDLSAYADADLIDVCDGSGESFLIWGVAAIALAKAESNASLALQQEQKFRDELNAWAVRRMMSEPRRRTLDGWVEPGTYLEGGYPL